MANKVSTSQKRIFEMMDALDLSQSDIVRRTQIPKSSLSNYLSGKRTPNQHQLSVIADPYGINPAWLMGYDVPMMLNQVQTFETSTDFELAWHRAGGGEHFPPNRFEIELILAFRAADKITQDNICKLLDVKRDFISSKEA